LSNRQVERQNALRVSAGITVPEFAERREALSMAEMRGLDREVTPLGKAIDVIP